MREHFKVGDYVHLQGSGLDYHATVIGITGDNCFAQVDFNSDPPPTDHGRLMKEEHCKMRWGGTPCRMFGNPSERARRVERPPKSLHEQLGDLWDPLLRSLQS